MDELTTIAKQYSKELDDIIQIFEEVGCSKDQLKKVLEGKSYVKWTELEDMALQSKNERQLSYLLKTKGQEEVDRRATFLGIVV